MKNLNKIILIGFMGSGKSSVAEVLSRKLGFELCELDQMILTKCGYLSIADLFEQKGETYFRDLESQVCDDLKIVESPVIISTGGGAVHREQNMRSLTGDRDRSICIFLSTEFKNIEKRLADTLGSRPLFKDSSIAHKLFEDRQAIYISYADLIVNTDCKSVEEVASEIISNLESR